MHSSDTDSNDQAANFLGANSDNKAFVLATVLEDAFVLEYASEALRDDNGIVEAASSRHTAAIDFASARLKLDLEL